MSLSILAWNIQGLHSSTFGLKTADPYFMSSIKNIDIVILTETWSDKNNASNCPCNYNTLVIPPLKQPKAKSGRLSGGIIIWYKENLTQQIQLIKKGKYHIWLKISDNTTYNQPLFLCAIYIPPPNSPYCEENAFEKLQNEILHFQTKGYTLICGDFNARTGRDKDFISTVGDDHISELSAIHTETLRKRESFDTITNKSGKKLLQMCKNLGVYIVNGRTSGDFLGRHTYCSHLGNSVIDYAITDLPHNKIKAFMVMPQLALSDHCQIKILLDIEKKPIKPDNTRLIPLQYKYRWNTDSPLRYAECSKTIFIENLFYNFLFTSHTTDRQSINLAVDEVTGIFLQIARLSGVIEERQAHTCRKIKHTKEDWFDSECFRAKHILRGLSNRKHRDPANEDIRLEYITALKHYKKLLRLKKTEFMSSKLDQIEDAIDNNSFWNLWHKLDNSKKNNPLPLTNGKIWKQYFEELYTSKDDPINKEQLKILKQLQEKEKLVSYQCELDHPILLHELSKQINALKNGKAVGIDYVSPEMLKNSTPLARKAILKLYNLVIRSGCFPTMWNKGFITPVFKKGDQMNPENYRGICVASILGNILCNILKSRILTLLEKNNTLNKSQIGFLPKFRTTDHIYTLNTLLEHHVQKTKGRIYACFVDFKKAFDTISHTGMQLKIIESGITGNVYTLIKDMYQHNQCCVKIKDKRTEFFKQGRGVRQGSSLSPILYNIFINDLANTIDQSTCPGIKLQDTIIKCLLFADDLVILSPTREGLQTNLDQLNSYCKKWALSINTEKTKVMTFQKYSAATKETDFRIGQTIIEQVANYNYLGLSISKTGKFDQAPKQLAEKAQRAYYAIKKKLYKFDPPIKIWLKLFDTVIKPIALYGSEIWGAQLSIDHRQWDKGPTELFHIQFCKDILGVHRTSSNMACRAELGRFPLSIEVNKRASKFWLHLAHSNSTSYHLKAFHHKLTTENDILFKIAYKNKITHLSHITKSLLIDIDKTNKNQYLEFWENEIKNNQKLDIYRALERPYCLAPYLLQVRERKKRRLMTKYRISDHNLNIEKGRHHKTWLPRERRTCVYCINMIENEEHFLIHCSKYTATRQVFFNMLRTKIPNFDNLSIKEMIFILLGEDINYCCLAADYLMTCHQLRDV